MPAHSNEQRRKNYRAEAEQEGQPEKGKGRLMSTWNSRGLRGSTLEDMVNRTNEQYREIGRAHV